MAGSTEADGMVLSQFNRLIGELLRGSVNRNCFRPWEIDLILDIESSDLRPAARRDLLRRYQKAVRRHFEEGGGPPPRLSEYLESRRARRSRRQAAVEPETQAAGEAVR